jgi:hypothetical protein
MGLVDFDVVGLERERARGAYWDRRKKRPKPPERIPRTPRTMSQMLLFVGEPVTALDTDDENEFEASRPYTRRMIPMMRNATDGIFDMANYF